MAVLTKQTKYGAVNRGTTCKDDHPNIATKTIGGIRAKGGPEEYKLQLACIESLRDVAKELGGPWRKRPVHVTGTWRSCAYQAELYARDSHRYAHPNTTLHTQGLAIDVDMNWRASVGPEKVDAALRKFGWKQSRPDDEPWHWSYGWTA